MSWARFLFAAALAVAPLSRAAAHGDLSLHDLMERLNALHNRMERNLLENGPLADWETDAGEADGLYQRLDGMYEPFYGGSAEDWRAYGRESRAVLAEARRAREAGDVAGAKEAFFRLAEIREKAHDDFRPGFLKRLSRIFKGKKEKNR